MDINLCKCPNCNNTLLYIQSKFENSKVAYASNLNVLKYAIHCYWCHFEFGDYETVSELKDKFENKFGGAECQKL